MQGIRRSIFGSVAIALSLPIELSSCADGTTVVRETPLPVATAGPAVTAPAGGDEGLDASLFRAAAPPARRSARVVPGSGTFVAVPGQLAPAATVVPLASGEMSLNFVGADVHEVVRVVLGDMLGGQYTIDPGVQGTITLQTSRPIDRRAVLAVLEDALRANGAALVVSDGIYRVVPLVEAARRSNGPVRTSSAGFRIKVVPLNYISAQEMKAILDPMAPPNAILRVDTSRNLLVLGGSQNELSAMLDTIAIFDVDWLRGMSVAVYPVHATNAKTMVEELQFVFGRDGGPLRDVVRLFPVERPNSVIVVSTQPRYLSEVERWINNLDQAEQSQQRRVFVYPIRHGKAASLATALTLTFGSGRVPAVERPAVERVAVGPGSGGAAVGSTPLMAPATAQPLPSAAADTPAAAVPSAGARAADTVRITPEEETNSLLIYATADEYTDIIAALDKLDIVPLQVLIEGVVAEVLLTDDLRYGVQWFFDAGKGEFTLSDLASGAVSSAFPGFSFALTGVNNVKAVLNALSSITDVNVISAPEVLVLSNQTATLQVGDQVPIATQSAQSILDPNALLVNTVQYKDTGVILEVTPRVNASGTIVMDVSQQVSDVVPTTTSNLNSPTIRQRQISSAVAVESGETIALGGLIRDARTEGNQGIPILKDIPYLGFLFGSTIKRAERTELLVLITPRIIRNTEDGRKITEELRQRMRVVQPLNSRIQ